MGLGSDNRIMDWLTNTRGYKGVAEAIPFTPQWTAARTAIVNRPWQDKLKEAIGGTLMVAPGGAKAAAPIMRDIGMAQSLQNAPGVPAITGGYTGNAINGQRLNSTADGMMNSSKFMYANQPVRPASNPTGQFVPPGGNPSVTAGNQTFSLPVDRGPNFRPGYPGMIEGQPAANLNTPTTMAARMSDAELKALIDKQYQLEYNQGIANLQKILAESKAKDTPKPISNVATFPGGENNPALIKALENYGKDKPKE